MKKNRSINTALPSRSKAKHLQKEVYSILCATGAYGSKMKDFMLLPENHSKNPLHGIDINAEYELIQSKLSSLPRLKRDLVCFMIENTAEIQKNIDAYAKEEQKDDQEK
jgi:hypothetical protein